MEEAMVQQIAKKIFSMFNANPSRKQPELHACKHCGAPVSRLYLISGGILQATTGTTVRMEIGCRDCHRSHKFKGSNVRSHWLALQLVNNTRSVGA
jgi:hypothetical protein